MEKPNVIPSMILLLRSKDTGGITERFFRFPLISRELLPELLLGEFCFVTLRPEFRPVPPDLRRFSVLLFRALRPAAGARFTGREPAVDLLPPDMFYTPFVIVADSLTNELDDLPAFIFCNLHIHFATYNPPFIIL